MSDQITVYEKPTCTTCRNLAMLFRENGIEWDKVNYFMEPFTVEHLTKLIAKTFKEAAKVAAQAKAKKK